MLKGLFATKSLEMLHAEMESDNRLRRVLGPVGLTSLGIGAIIGAGIFVMTGRVAANDAGPAILLSFVVAGIACGLAAFCYAEFASMAPVAGSAYTYAYATLGELFAWIIGWDLVLEYAMSAATVAAAWTEYFNEFTKVWFDWQVPDYLCHDPITDPNAWLNLPAVLILLAVTAVLIVGIRESAFSNTTLVIVKLGVVVFVILVGIAYIQPSNYTGIPHEHRKFPEQRVMSMLAHEVAEEEAKTQSGLDVDERAAQLTREAVAVFRAQKGIPTTVTVEDPAELAKIQKLIEKAHAQAPAEVKKSWGLLAHIGIDAKLAELDDATRSNFMPYGISGVMLGAALVFFAFLGFDSISTHSEEAVKPQRDVPIGIIASLVVCTILYLGVSAIIVGMVPYPEIDTSAAVASAFEGKSDLARGLIAAGGLAGMTSVLLITFLSQARIFLAMARDGLLPHAIFGKVHTHLRTPHVSTLVTGLAMAAVAAFTPISLLEEMVNIGTFFAFIVVCAAVLILRFKRPEAHRPFRCPAVYLIAPLGILVNLAMMLFLAPETWARLVIWLAIGLALYFSFGYHYSVLRNRPAV